MLRRGALIALTLGTATGLAPSAHSATSSVDCVEPPYNAAGGATAQRFGRLLDDLGPLLDELPSLRAALDHQAPLLCLDSRTTDTVASLDARRGIIALGAGLSYPMQLVTLIHELRHLDQLAHGFCPGNDLSMQEMARATFAVEADAQAITTLAAWRLRDLGQPVAWEALERWPSVRDITARFADEMAANGDPALAVSAAFDQWYASADRVDAYYLASCSDYLDRQDATKTLPKYGLLPADFMTRLCRLPDGRPYGCPDSPASPR